MNTVNPKSAAPLTHARSYERDRLGENAARLAQCSERKRSDLGIAPGSAELQLRILCDTRSIAQLNDPRAMAPAHHRFSQTRRKRRVPRRIHVFSLLLGVALTPLTAAPLIPAKSPTTPVLLRGGTVHPVSGLSPGIADILIVNGRIAAIDAQLAPSSETRIVNVAGQHIYPGLIAANTSLGVHEISSIVATLDVTETGPINPNARAQVAVNPDNAHLGVTRLNGILSTLVVPVSGLIGGPAPALIAGQSALMRLEGWTWEEMTLRDSVALHIYWPDVTLDRRPRGAKPLDEQQKQIDRKLETIREAFAQARAYQRSKDGGVRPETDTRWEAMLPFVRGDRPIFIHADELKQIASALDWAQSEEKLKVTLVGGLDAWRVAARLKARDIPVVLGGTHQLPLRRDDSYDAAFTVAAKLHAAGVRFCIAPAGVGSNGQDRNLAYQAAKAAAHGLPPAEALKAITLYPAQILGVGDELGSIDVGKRATLIVTDGDPLEITTQVTLALIDGAEITLRSRHTELRDKYQERIRRVNEARPKSAVAR